MVDLGDLDPCSEKLILQKYQKKKLKKNFEKPKKKKNNVSNKKIRAPSLRTFQCDFQVAAISLFLPRGMAVWEREEPACSSGRVSRCFLSALIGNVWTLLCDKQLSVKMNLCLPGAGFLRPSALEGRCSQACFDPRFFWGEEKWKLGIILVRK